MVIKLFFYEDNKKGQSIYIECLLFLEFEYEAGEGGIGQEGFELLHWVQLLPPGALLLQILDTMEPVALRGKVKVL